MDTAQTLAEEFETLIRFIDRALGAARSGVMPDLKDLDARVADLCQRVTTTDAQSAKNVQPVMGTMIARLDELAHHLHSLQENSKEKF